jgi:hypothetical protein
MQEFNKLKELLNQQNPQSHSFEIGKNYFVRTATYHHVGRLIQITEADIVLENASWIADSGRFHDALKTGKLEEVEPFVNPVIINRSSIIDTTIWDHNLPKEQK